MKINSSRRQMLGWATATAGGLLLPPSVWAASKTLGMTEGPFYPRAKDLPLDQDNDLTTIAGKSGVAAGVLLDFGGRVVDEKGKPLRNALVEIWQCNAHGRYHDSRDDSRAPLDPFFQGFGKTVTDAEGRYRFRTIKPVAYPGRTPHIHFKVKSRDFGELTSQVLIDGDPGNAGDFVLRSIRNEADRKRVLMTLNPAPANSTAKLVTDFEIVVG
ncbi:MAG: intradiol ring-cleavage dioxygenase [Betaproteobacteria bacterium]|nr:intradiol ring-cleavage dioxygenase [Betaproteobacteria bacterium]